MRSEEQREKIGKGLHQITEEENSGIAKLERTLLSDLIVRNTGPVRVPLHPPAGANFVSKSG